MKLRRHDKFTYIHLFKIKGMKNLSQTKDKAKVHPHHESEHRHQLYQLESSLGSVSNNEQSLIVHDAKRQIFKQTDQMFLREVKEITDLQQNQILKFIKSGKVQLTPTIYNELHYKATIHKNANIVNKNTKIQFSKLSPSDKCFCGCRRGKGKFFSYFTTNEQKLKVLGPGILLLFLFKRASIVMLLTGIFIYSLFGFTTNILSNNAELTEKCESQSYCKFKIEASDENKSLDFVFHSAQRWLAVGFCLVWILMLRAVKYLGMQKNRIIDDKLKSASDFAIKIENLPRGAYSESQLIGYVEQIWKRKLIQKIKTKNQQNQKQQSQNQSKNEIKNVEIAFDSRFKLKIKSIQIIYNMQFVRNLSGKITKLASEVNDLLFQQGQSAGKVFVIQRDVYLRKKKDLLESYQLLNDFRKRFLNEPQFRKKISTTCCIMEFQTQKRREAVISYFGTEKMGIWAQFLLNVKNCLRGADRSTLFYGNVLKIEKAPEPSDILWLNCEQPESSIRRFGLFMATILIIIVSFGAIFGLTYLKSDIEKHPEKYWQTLNFYINYVISFLMIGINKISWELMSILLNFAYYHTETERIISLMRRVLIIQCINIIALPIFSNWIVYGPDSIYGNQGLAGLSFDYHISNITTTAKGLFDILYILKVIALMIPWSRYKIIWWKIRNPSKINLKKGEPQVNKLYEGINFDIAENYIFILSATMHAAFFCRLQPILIFLNMCAILLLYLVNRYKIIRLCKIPGMTEYLVFDTALTFMALIPLFYGVGAVVLEYLSFLKHPAYTFTIQNCIPAIICAAFGLVAFFNPGQILNKIVYSLIEKIIGSVMDTEDHEIDVDDIEEKNEQDQDSVTDSKDLIQVQAKAKQQDNKNARIESYYKESNSLCLFGFERVFRGESIRREARELKKYCQSFFEKDLKMEDLKEVVVQANLQQFIEGQDHQQEEDEKDEIK